MIRFVKDVRLRSLEFLVGDRELLKVFEQKNCWCRININEDVRRSIVGGKGECSGRYGEFEVLSRLCR